MYINTGEKQIKTSQEHILKQLRKSKLELNHIIDKPRPTFRYKEWNLYEHTNKSGTFSANHLKIKKDKSSIPRIALPTGNITHNPD